MWEKGARVCSIAGGNTNSFWYPKKNLLLTNGPILISDRCELNYRPILDKRGQPRWGLPVRKDLCRNSDTCCPSCALRTCQWNSRSRRQCREPLPAVIQHETTSGSWGCGGNSMNTTRKTGDGTERKIWRLLFPSAPNFMANCYTHVLQQTISRPFLSLKGPS